MAAIKIVLLIILAYLIGSFPTGVLVGKIFFKKDIRKFGSGNTGSTNSFRVLGPTAGTIVLIIDVLKGTVASLLPQWAHLGPHYLVLLFGAVAILGHTFSIFLKFHGGKAVATSAGVLLGYSLNFFLVCAVVFIPMVFITSMISVSSLISVVIIFIASFFFHDKYLTLVAAGMVILFYARHISNIKRILNHDENMVPFGLYYWYKQRKKKRKSKSQ